MATAPHTVGSPARLHDGTGVRDHYFTVPLDYQTPEGEQLTVYAREFFTPDAEDKPWLLYLQGGPGGKGSRPARVSGWLAEALKYYRVLMLDQRGTGLSTPVNHHTLRQRGAPLEQARYLTNFRAPNIVSDAEAIRRALGSDPWVTLGQSFGGFCTLTYLSFAPEGLAGAMITGGIPPLQGLADQVYQATYRRMHSRNREYFRRFPKDLETLTNIYRRVRRGDVVLPDGSPLTVGRVQALGMYLGGNTRIDALHYVLEEAFIPGTDILSDTFLNAIYQQVSRATNPLYLILHEAIYAQPGAQPTAWAAQRVLAQYPEFNPKKADTPLLTGEMCFDWYPQLDPALQPVARATQIIADCRTWGPLYDLDQLAANEVPVAALVYTDDVYVDRDLSLAAAEQVANLQVWESDRWHHDGIGEAGAEIFIRLHEMIQPS
ncbi:alpha/beta fold hydrolase [Enteractinococcus coprophilus]|uniref:Alpha/beta hydrolase family protein n=1 Tax=Enteractinococcus coprophilus TaxID=1027633 RepID=A0A543AJ64_9MICC|nr:alpha/beta fold hydrolase [Enteractinococcus coprophilus]TQL72618.1 alpha/beta hydrolase family protein [Enteractinococcus coprophilus]